MNKFEAVILLSTELGSQNLKSEIDRFKSNINNKDGKIVNEEENAEIETYPVSSGDDESGGCQHNKSLPQGLFIMLMTSLLLARIQRETWLKMGFVNHK